MNKQRLILFSLAVFVALALIPLAAAQEGNMLTDTLSSWGESITGAFGQVSEYVTTHIPETAAVGTTGGAAVGLGYAYKKVSSAKSALQSAYDSLSGKVESITTRAKTEKEALTAQLSEQSSSIQSKIKAETDKATSQIKTEAEAAQLKLTQEKTALGLQLEEQKKNYENLVIENKTLSRIVGNVTK